MKLVTLVAHAISVSVIGFAVVNGESSCQHESTPKKSYCEGCPPMFEGKPCASTTRYNDMTKGACGCGSEPNPIDFWTKVKLLVDIQSNFLRLSKRKNQLLG
jgi:hypothetical protein